MTINFFGEIDIVNKNWPKDPRIGHKSPFSLLVFIDIDGDLEEELEIF